MSVLLRRSAYVLSRTPIVFNMGRIGSTRMISSNKEQFGHHPAVEIGDLVTYTDAAGGKSAGYIQKIFEESGAQGKKDSHLAEIQNYHTKKIAYTELKNVQSVARKHGEATQTTAQKATTTPSAAQKTTTPSAAQKTTPPPPPPSKSTQGSTQGSTQASTQASTKASTQASTHASTQASTQASTASQASSAQGAKSPMTQTYMKESAQKLEELIDSESSPLNADFAPGDIVRYRVAQNFTAGVVQEVVYTTTHDEHGNFHGATKENPMARLENLWTKNITYHHLNVLEHVKRARDVTPGRLAEQEFAAYDKK